MQNDRILIVLRLIAEVEDESKQYSRLIEINLIKLIKNPENTELPFSNIRTPTLIINAIDDPTTLIEGTRNLARRIQNSQLVTFDTGGHILLGQEEEIKHQISKFIRIHT